MTKISIITPCLNTAHSIAETIESVLTQSAVLSGRATLEYIICDGGSGDGTVEVIRSRKSDAIRLISEPDGGMYDALAKGIRLASGDVVAYINAGDYYHKCAFDVVLDIFEQKGIKWLTGYNVAYNEKSYLTGFNLPYRYRRNFFRCGIYGTVLPFVEQESTFWSSELNVHIDLDRLSAFRYAGDFYLWSRFSSCCDLKIVEAHLGGFKHQEGQLSGNRGAYLAEMRSLVRRPGLLEYLLAYIDKAVWFSYPTFKKMLNREGIYRYSHKLKAWT